MVYLTVCPDELLFSKATRDQMVAEENPFFRDEMGYKDQLTHPLDNDTEPFQKPEISSPDNKSRRTGEILQGTYNGCVTYTNSNATSDGMHGTCNGCASIGPIGKSLQNCDNFLYLNFGAGRQFHH